MSFIIITNCIVIIIILITCSNISSKTMADSVIYELMPTLRCFRTTVFAEHIFFFKLILDNLIFDIDLIIFKKKKNVFELVLSCGIIVARSVCYHSKRLNIKQCKQRKNILVIYTKIYWLFQP